MATILKSWKSIAAYTNIGVRTAQRWTKERGFPVRGEGNGYKRIVVATTEEIDEWVLSQSTHGSQNGNAEAESLQRRIADLQSENDALRLKIRTMQMGATIRERRSANPDEVLSEAANLLQVSSALQQERREIIDRSRMTAELRSANGSSLTLRLLDSTLAEGAQEN